MTEIIIRGPMQLRTTQVFLARLDLTKEWRVTIIRYQQRRSMSQNGLLHKWFDEIAEEIGDDAESVKDTLKNMFGSKVEHTNKITGEVSLRPQKTSKMNAAEMAEFMEKVSAFAHSQLGVMLTAPEDQHLD